MGAGEAALRLVGRSQELAALDGLWRAAQAADPCRVLIDGEAGMGKTALWQHFTSSRDAPTVFAIGDANEINVPFATVQQLLDQPPTPGRDPLSVGTDLLSWFGAAQQDSGIIVVIDDLQWVDAPSLQALAFALRRLRADRVLAVLACREGEVPASVHRLLQTGPSVHLRVEGLGLEEVAELATTLGRGQLSTHALRALREHTRGSPLHLQALLRELDDGPLASAGTQPLPAPRSFARLVQARLAACSSQTEDLVAAAAVLGQRIRLTDASALAGLDDPTVALGEAVDTNLLVAVPGPGPMEVAFSHPLVRSAIYHDLNPARRSRLHLAAASSADVVVAIEHRIAGALTEDPALATEVALLAATEAAEGSFAAAAAHLRSAAGLADDPELKNRFKLDAAQLLLAAGTPEDVGDLLPPPSEPASARAHCVRGHLALLSGDQDEAEQALVAAWDMAQTNGEVDVAAHAATLLGHIYLFWQQYALAAEWASRALEKDPTSPLTTTAHGVRLVGLLPAAGEAAVDEAAAWLPPSVDNPSAAQIEALLGRGIAGLWAGNLPAARRDLTAAADTSRSWRPLRARILALGYLAEAEYRLGDWDQSIAHGMLGASLAEDADQTWLLAFSHGQATAALAARGRFDDAAAHVAASREAAELLGDAANAAFAAVAMAQLAFARDDRVGVVEALQPLLDVADRQGIDEPGFFPWRELLAGALTDLGRHEEAEKVVAPFEALAAERGRAWPRAAASRARGRLQGALGDLESAAAAFAQAAEFADAAGMPFEQALGADDHGRALRRVGKRRAAAELLGRALQLYQQLGADPYAARCRRELAACGVRERAASVRPGLDLTPQEIAVVRLLLTGRRNREIATELVVSVKTVEYHLGNIYLKLGVSSRAELIARHAAGAPPISSVYDPASPTS